MSFGKDSMATLDLCCRLFPRVEGYYLFRVRGLEIVDEWAEMTRKRWSVTVRMYPHFDLSRAYHAAVLQPHWKETEKVAKVTFADIERQFRSDTKVEWIAYGWRRNDSFSRALIMKSCAGYDPKARRVFPLRSWKRSDVYAYLKARDIPVPEKIGREEQSGLDFHPASIAMLKRRKGDWEKWRRDFPFSEVQSVGSGQAVPSTGSGETEAGDRAESSNTDPQRKSRGQRPRR